MKFECPQELLENLDLFSDDKYHYFRGRLVRVNRLNRLDIADDDFDRWANSVVMSFDMNTPMGRVEFTEWGYNFDGTSKASQ